MGFGQAAMTGISLAASATPPPAAASGVISTATPAAPPAEGFTLPLAPLLTPAPPPLPLTAPAVPDEAPPLEPPAALCLGATTETVSAAVHALDTTPPTKRQQASPSSPIEFLPLLMVR